MNREIEYRACSLPGCELRAVSETNRTVRGLAVPYRSPSLPINSGRRPFIEQILPQAFAESLRSEDIMAFAHHDSAKILGRTSAGTLELREASDGIWATIQLPNTTVGQDTFTSIRRGDLKNFSFGFTAKEDRWNSDGSERQVVRGQLFEVSIVSSAAYPATSVSARSLGLAVDSEIGIYAAPVKAPLEPELDYYRIRIDAVDETERERQRLKLRLARML